MLEGRSVHIFHLDVKLVLAKLKKVLVLVLEVLLILELILETAHFEKDLVVALVFFGIELLFKHVDQLDLLFRHLGVVDVVVAVLVSDQDKAVQALLSVLYPLCLLFKGWQIVDLVFFE